MCSELFDHRRIPVDARHLGALIKRFPEQEAFLSDTYAALTDHLNPALTTLVTLAVMKLYLDQKKYGVFRSLKAISVPLSVIGKHDEVRYRPPVTDAQHEAFLSLNMSQRNMKLLDEAMRQHGVRLYMRCSCGVLMCRSEDYVRLEESALMKESNNYRSSLDVRFKPVRSVTDWSGIPENIDITTVEEEMLNCIDAMTLEIARIFPLDEETLSCERSLETSRALLISNIDNVLSESSANVA